MKLISVQEHIDFTAGIWEIIQIYVYIAVLLRYGNLFIVHVCPTFGHMRGSFALLLKYGHLFIICASYMYGSTSSLLKVFMFHVIVGELYRYVNDKLPLCFLWLHIFPKMSKFTSLSSNPLWCWCLCLFHSVAAQCAALRWVWVPGQLHHDRCRKSVCMLQCCQAPGLHGNQALLCGVTVGTCGTSLLDKGENKSLFVEAIVFSVDVEVL